MEQGPAVDGTPPAMRPSRLQEADAQQHAWWRGRSPAGSGRRLLIVRERADPELTRLHQELIYMYKCRKLMLSSTLAVAAALLALGGAFRLLEGSPPAVNAAASTCPAGPPPGSCPACLTAGCGAYDRKLGCFVLSFEQGGERRGQNVFSQSAAAWQLPSLPHSRIRLLACTA